MRMEFLHVGSLDRRCCKDGAGQAPIGRDAACGRTEIMLRTLGRLEATLHNATMDVLFLSFCRGHDT